MPIILKGLKKYASAKRKTTNEWFFKTGKGQYGEGDVFIGVSNPDARIVVKKFANSSIEDITNSLASAIHEERFVGVLILVAQYEKAKDKETRLQIAQFYLQNMKRINNWDLVDSSAGYIVGTWLDGQPDKIKALTKLAKSKLLWERRIAMIATLYFIVEKSSVDEALTVVEILKNDSHDLIQKAVGWMLREVGKRVDEEILTNFLDQNAATLPRTTLRYAIEKLTISQRQHYLGLKDV